MNQVISEFSSHPDIVIVYVSKFWIRLLQEQELNEQNQSSSPNVLNIKQCALEIIQLVLLSPSSNEATIVI